MPRRGLVRFNLRVTASGEISGLSNAELGQLVLDLLRENAEQKRAIAELREEIARLKGSKGRPDIKPSGMETGATPKSRDKRAGRPGRGKVTPRVSVEETLVPAGVPPGSRFRGRSQCRGWWSNFGRSVSAFRSGR